MFAARRVRQGLLTATLLAIGVVPPAGAATQIGETFTPAPDSCLGPITFLQSLSPQASYTVLSPGVITAWSHEASVPTTPIKFKVGNRGPGDSFQIVGESELKTPVAGTLNNYMDIRITVEPGQVIGLYVEGQGGCIGGAPGYAEHYVTADVLPGPAQVFDEDIGDYQLDLAATVEPDADGDGFGDETQDECPTDAAIQGPCPAEPPDTDPPETEITNGAPNKLDKSKVKFKFTADEPNATFECKVDKKPYKPCSSPKKVKRLDDGKHKFKVIATDEAGNSDPSAAKDKFKVVD